MTADKNAHPVLVVMGVCGAGKSLLAAGLAEDFNLPMIEADDFHSDANRAKMAKGIGLTDEDRMPWLKAVCAAARTAASADQQTGVVIACSALRRIYRDVFRTAFPGCQFVHLTGAPAVLAERLTHRTGHFVDSSLLDSQLVTLEPLEADENGISIDVSLPKQDVRQTAVDFVNRVPA